MNNNNLNDLSRMKTEADKLRNSIQHGLGVMDSGSGEFKELSNKIDELFELSYLEGQSSPKIKQLEWKSYIGYYAADTHLVDYLITPEYGTDVNAKHLLWINKSPISSYRTLDEAKAAAQADFEKRVMECFDYE